MCRGSVILIYFLAYYFARVTLTDQSIICFSQPAFTISVGSPVSESISSCFPSDVPSIIRTFFDSLSEQPRDRLSETKNRTEYPSLKEADLFPVGYATKEMDERRTLCPAIIDPSCPPEVT